MHKKCHNLTHHWTWVEYATRQCAIINITYLVHGKDKGREAWYYVLGCKEQFKNALSHEAINLEEHGIVKYGDNPPDDIDKRIQELLWLLHAEVFNAF